MTCIYIPQDSLALSVGADEIAASIETEAAKRGLNIQIVRNASRGMSWLEPFVEIESTNGRVGYGPVTVADISSLFEQHFLQADLSHSLCRGHVDDIPFLKNQQRLIFSRLGLGDPLSLATYKSLGGYRGLEKALSLSSQAIIDEVKTSGLRGRGGAAFPAGIKWQTVHDAAVVSRYKQEAKKYIVCNADEGDSGTFADRMLMEGDPFTLIEGMTIAAIAVGATQGYIYLRSEYPHAKKMLLQAISTARKANLLGENIMGSSHQFDIEIRMGAGSYICGEETAMLESLEGKRGMVRAKPPLPAIEGLFGQPTVVNNVITLASVPFILSSGAEQYKSYGCERSLGTMPFQLAGNIKQGGLVELAFGLSLRELINQFGAGTFTGRPIKAVQVGGPLGAYLSEKDLDTPLDYEAFADKQAMLGHGGVVVFDDTVDMAEQAQFAMSFCVAESCGKCTPCRIGSVRGEELLQKIRGRQGDTQVHLQLLDELCETMTEGSLCAMGGMTPAPVLSAVKHFRKDFVPSEQEGEK